MQARPGQRVVAIFQPHRYSRTYTFLNEFAASFSHADVVVLTDIYSAGEPDTGLISGEKLSAEVAKNHSQVEYQPTLADVRKYLEKNLRPGDLALFLGAGNLNQTIPLVIDSIKQPAQATS